MRRRRQDTLKEKPVDLLQGDEGDNGATREYPQYYQAEPFVMPEPTDSSQAGHGQGRPSAAESSRRDSHITSNPSEASPSDPSTKSAAGLRQMRPVNVIQHEDAGPGISEEPQGETVEVPPAYTNLRK